MLDKLFKKSIIDKVLNDDVLAPLLENKLNEYPLNFNEIKNVLVIEVESGVIYATVCGRNYNSTLNKFMLSKPKEQKKLIPLLKELVTLAKKG